MTSDELHAARGTTRTDPPQDTPPAVTPELLQRVRSGGRDATPEEVLSAVVDELRDGDVADVSLPESLVTQSLDGILVALIALRDDGTHGTGLMEDMERLFDVRPSPGTVYPRLHDLEADDTLVRHDLVQTKQYAIDDATDAEALIEDALYRHLTIGLFLHAALDAV